LRQRSVLWADFMNPALDLLEFRGKRIQFLCLSRGFDTRVLPIQQPCMLFRLSSNQPLQFSFSLYHGCAYPTSNFCFRSFSSSSRLMIFPFR
jgi:hypothetical protein